MSKDKLKVANDILLQMQRIEDLVDCFYRDKLKLIDDYEDKHDEYLESWDMVLNGHHTSLSSKTFNIIVDGLRQHHRELEEELKSLIKLN